MLCFPVLKQGKQKSEETNFNPETRPFIITKTGVASKTSLFPQNSIFFLVEHIYKKNIPTSYYTMIHKKIEHFFQNSAQNGAKYPSVFSIIFCNLSLLLIGELK